ncbi:hypothetical protein Rs2_11793 [Raphanus sativus]|uniref:Uncharacterized protein LOC108846269 n=1 Tax=Raphanus sativus TaxID=3726 RepID=A0A6J0MR94_RAPSA|nr:uncharacterized protein LOC108846269 [Raphanus sativus]KAJ4908135.1 hypothetical protein Rs2_11793 [Raphanus sativus]
MADSGHEIDISCHHCAGPLTKSLETSELTVTPFIRDSFSMIGSAVGGTASAFIGFNHVMPIVRKWIKGPMLCSFSLAPPVIVLSSACAGLAGGTLPALAQLASSSYRATIHSSQPPPQAEENNKLHKSSSASPL